MLATIVLANFLPILHSMELCHWQMTLVYIEIVLWIVFAYSALFNILTILLLSQIGLFAFRSYFSYLNDLLNKLKHDYYQGNKLARIMLIQRRLSLLLVHHTQMTTITLKQSQIWSTFFNFLVICHASVNVYMVTRLVVASNASHETVIYSAIIFGQFISFSSLFYWYISFSETIHKSKGIWPMLQFCTGNRRLKLKVAIYYEGINNARLIGHDCGFLGVISRNDVFKVSTLFTCFAD